MWKSIKKWWRYLGAKLGMQLDASADAKVQLEQAIQQAREQHRLLTEQAANVIANQTQLQFRLDRALDEYQKANASARQALVLADQEARAGHADKVDGFNQAAEAFANRIVELEREIADLKVSLLSATQAAGNAKEAVALNSAALQKTLGERERLLSQLDRATMQEQMNSAMAQLKETIGDEVPTFEEVRTKIERRLAAAQAMTELSGASVDAKMLEVEQMQKRADSEARLGEMRNQLGLGGDSMIDAGAPAEAPTKGAGAD
jgi:phage shock protein A